MATLCSVRKSILLDAREEINKKMIEKRHTYTFVGDASIRINSVQNDKDSKVTSPKDRKAQAFNIAKQIATTIGEVYKGWVGAYIEEGTYADPTYVKLTPNEKYVQHIYDTLPLEKQNEDANIMYQLSPNSVDFTLKSINILESDKAKQIFEKGKKANWDLNKILSELQIPKEQKQIILDLGITDREQIALELASNYSFAVEINTAKTNINSGGATVQELDDIYVPSLQETFYFSYRDGWFKEDRNQDRIIATKEELKAIEEYKNKDATQNSAFYSNLTVPGGTNGSYIEANIETPLIAPSIKGHSQFSTDTSIGWYRMDEKQQYQEKDIENLIEIMKKNGILEVNCN